MAQITEKNLIGQIKMLKSIEPRKEWVSLLKSQIITEKTENRTENWKIGKFIENWKLVIENSSSRKLAYAFAVLAIMVVGVLGFAQYTVPGDALFPIKKLAEQSQASLMGKTTINKEIANLNSRINDLAQVAKGGKTENFTAVVAEIKNNASELARGLKNETANPSEIKEIAASLKTLADVPGTDLSENQDVKDLYEAVVSSQIEDLQKTTLTQEQKDVLEEIIGLYDEGKYAQALEKILMINN